MIKQKKKIGEKINCWLSRKSCFDKNESYCKYLFEDKSVQSSEILNISWKQTRALGKCIFKGWFDEFETGLLYGAE